MFGASEVPPKREKQHLSGFNRIGAYTLEEMKNNRKAGLRESDAEHDKTRIDDLVDEMSAYYGIDDNASGQWGHPENMATVNSVKAAFAPPKFTYKPSAKHERQRT